jgi:hypothetical protein
VSAAVDHTLRVMQYCAELIARVSPAAREELLRHAATLRRFGAENEFATPDIPGGSREAPAHQGGLPPGVGEDDRTPVPVNSCPGAASDDAVGFEDKAADPASSARRARRRGRPAAASPETLAEIERRWRAGQPTGLIARQCGLTTKAVYNMAYKRRWPRPETPPMPPRRVAEPSVAARELAEAAAAEGTAQADDATIREWGRANGVEIDRFLAPDGVADLVNARRRELGLTPFRRVARPLGALPADELRRMRGVR